MLTRKEINALKKEFVWGEITKVHQIGDITIFEYLEDERFNASTGEMEPAGVTRSYHMYVGMKDTNHSDDTLDGAILVALGVKYQGLNSQFSTMASRMLEMESYDPDSKKRNEI